MSEIRAWLFWWVLGAALWLALVDRVALDELLTGVVAAALGATAAVLVRRQRRTLLRPQPSWLPAAARASLGLVRDVPLLARVLVARGVLRRPGSGTVHVLKYDLGGDDPDAVARRFATAALGSLGPNTIVVDIDGEAGLVYAHRLSSAGDPKHDALPLR